MSKGVYLAENLTFIRKQKKVRQYQLAVQIGVQPSTISNYEKEISMPDLVTLGKIKKALDVSVDDLVYLEPREFAKKYGQDTSKFVYFCPHKFMKEKPEHHRQFFTQFGDVCHQMEDLYTKFQEMGEQYKELLDKEYVMIDIKNPVEEEEPEIYPAR